MDAIDKASFSDQLFWFHSIDLGDNVVTKGVKSPQILRTEADLIFKHGVKDLSILDIGAWNGYFSFEAKRRGASRVLATDHYCWNGPGHGTKDGFDLAKRCTGLDVEELEIDVPEISTSTVGHFDVVLFLGVFYHLQNPFAALERIAPIARKRLIVETHIDALDVDRPAMVFYPRDELGGDGSNWWGPNPSCVIEMLQVCGFQKVDFTRNPDQPTRGIFHAHR